MLLYLKSAKNGRKTKGKYTQAINSHGSSSKEERDSADAEDSFLSIEEEIKAKTGGFFEDTAESEVKTEEVPVVNLDKTVADIEGMEGEIDTKQEADIKDVRAEFTAKIEGLISKIEEVEKEVINKVENVVDTRVQEVLSKINDRIDEVLQAQKDSTALVLEKMINSLRQKEEPVFNKIQEEVAKVPEKTKEEDLEIPSEVNEDEKVEGEGQITSSEVKEEKISELDSADSADFDIQEFLEELENLPSEKDPETEK